MFCNIYKIGSSIECTLTNSILIKKSNIKTTGGNNHETNNFYTGFKYRIFEYERCFF
jgi:hypothetical protein